MITVKIKNGIFWAYILTEISVGALFHHFFQKKIVKVQQECAHRVICPQMAQKSAQYKKFESCKQLKFDSQKITKFVDKS